MLLLNRILEATSLLDTRQSRTWTQYFWIVILRYCNDTGCLESEEFFQKLRVRGKWSHFLQTLIGKFYRSINAPSEKGRKIYQEFLARKMSTFLSFPSIHHIFKVSTLFRRKHTQVARYDRDVFFRVFDRSLFEKIIFRSLVSIYNFKHSRLLYTTTK